MLLAFILAVLVQTNLGNCGMCTRWRWRWASSPRSIFPLNKRFSATCRGCIWCAKRWLEPMILQVSRILGPAFAGFVIATVGTAISFWLNGASFIAVIISLLVVRSHQIRKQGAGNPFNDFAIAIEFVRAQPRLQDLLMLVVLVTFFGLSVLNIMPAFASDVLHGDAQTLGLLLAALGHSALLSVVFVIPFIQAAKRTGVVIASAAIWMGFWVCCHIAGACTFCPWRCCASVCPRLALRRSLLLRWASRS